MRGQNGGGFNMNASGVYTVTDGCTFVRKPSQMNKRFINNITN
jgi:hypothetical protein